MTFTLLKEQLMRVLHSARSVAAIALAALTWGCGAATPTTPPPPPPTPAFTLAITSGPLSLLQGASGSVTVAITRTGGFTGAVLVQAEGLPIGATAAPITIAAGSSAGQLSIVLAADATVGASIITLRGSGTGASASTGTVSLSIAAPPPAGGMSIVAAPSPLSIQAGASGQATVTLTRVGGFAGAVSVAAEGLPTGASAAPISIAAGSSSGQMTIALTAGTVAGTSTITLRATATGIAAATTTLSLTVTAIPPVGSFTMSALPTALSVAAGASGQTAITLVRLNGYSNAVTLTATTTAGVSVAFSPASVTGPTSTVTISVAGGTSAGVVQLTIRANATGHAEQTATIALTITSGGGGGGGNVTWAFCESYGLPLWAAAQDGSGAWTRITPTGQNYAFQVSSAKGGIAYVIPKGSGTELRIFYGTQAELQSHGGTLCNGRTGAARTMTGTTSNTPPIGSVMLSIGSAQGAATGGAFSIPLIRSGTVDLLGSASSITVVGLGVTLTPQRLFMRRSIGSATQGAIGNLDFTGAESFAPATATATITNAPGETSTAVGSFLTSNGDFATYFTGLGGTGGTQTIYGLPTDKRLGGELHVMNISSTASLDPFVGATRNVGLVFAAMGDQTVTHGPVMTMPTISNLGGGRLQAVYPQQAEYNRYWVANFQQTNGPSVTIEMTNGWLGGGGNVTLATPDFTTLSGWNNAWYLLTGTTASWTVTGSGWVGGNGITSPPFVDGARYISGTQRAQTVP